MNNRQKQSSKSRVSQGKKRVIADSRATGGPRLANSSPLRHQSGPQTAPHIGPPAGFKAPPSPALSGQSLQVEHRPIEALIPYRRNARTHSDAQVAEIAASIRSFGWTNPILVDGENGVVAGHGRLLAARKLGMQSVPVIELAGMSAPQKRAYLLADNKLALNAGWDEGLLAAEIADLNGMGIDLTIAGFADFEIEKLLEAFQQAGASSFPDEASEPPVNPVTRSGDLWILGEHRLVCGDATNESDISKVLDASLADMTFTDPPYNVAYASADRTVLNDNLGGSFGAFLEMACRNILKATKGSIYICMSSSELDTLKTAFTAAGGHWSTFVVWAKNTFTLGRSDYQRQYEPILYGWTKGTDHFWCGSRDQGDVWFFDKPRINDLHPTMKPIALVERAIRNSSKSKDTILDPFGGSGTTLMAAESSGRKAALVELDPCYCDVIIQRWQSCTLAKAIREDGIPFAELTAGR